MSRFAVRNKGRTLEHGPQKETSLMHLERTSPQRERVVEVASIIFTSSFLSALCVRVILGRRSLEIDINVEKKNKQTMNSVATIR